SGTTEAPTNDPSISPDQASPEHAPREQTPPRRALVTGGSRGIGRRIAEILASGGMGAPAMDVVLTYRREADAAAEVVDAITAAGGSARAHRLELESEEDIDRLFAEEFPE